MMKVCLIVVAFIAATVSAADFKLQAREVCFGAKHSAYGTFKVRSTGRITALKLVHTHGKVACGPDPRALSNWGCNQAALVGVVLTTSGNRVIFPKNLNQRIGWYNAKGFNSRSKELVLKNPFPNNKVTKGQTLRLWYGEDLAHFTEENNKGESCADVYAEIEPDFKLQAMEVCFGAKHSAYGTFKVKTTGRITALKLVHTHGKVACGPDPRALSNWGCNQAALVGVVLTTSGNRVIFPKNLNQRIGWYNAKGFNSRSKELVLKNPFPNNKVTKGQTLRLWYGEDLEHFTEENNKGESCADVYAEIQ